MCMPPPADAVRAVLGAAVPSDVTIDKIEETPPIRPQRVYELKLSDARSLSLVTVPSPMLRLLRSEEGLTKTEAAVVRWVREEVLRLKEGKHPAREMGGSQPTKSADVDLPSASRHTNDPQTPESASTLNLAPGFDLLQYLPSLIAHFSGEPSPAAAPLSSPSPAGTTVGRASPYDSPRQPFSPPYNIFDCPLGMPIALLPEPLTTEERQIVDFQAGKLVRHLSLLSPESGMFGPALAVLEPPPVGSLSSHLGAPAGIPALGTWSMAFHSILESVLREAEDMSIMLSYSSIRGHLRRLGHILDTVTSPRLVIVDSLDDSNLLVTRQPASEPEADSRRSGDGGSGGSSSSSSSSSSNSTRDNEDETTGDGPQADSSRTRDKKVGDDNSPTPDAGEASEGEEPKDTAAPSEGNEGYRNPSPIAVTGLRDWSHCMFGDPLFSAVFSDNPSHEFLCGFVGRSGFEDAGGERGERLLLHGNEDKEAAATRLLLYECYHAAVQIAKEFYRKRAGGSTRELSARKRLNVALAALDQVEDAPKRGHRHRRPSGEMSPAKRPKSEGESSTPASGGESEAARGYDHGERAGN